jgi:hypothetical protein
MCDSCKKAAHRFVIRYKDSYEHRTNDGDEIVEAKRVLFDEVGRFVLNSYMFDETESGFGATYYGSIDDFKCEMFIIGKQVVFSFSENDSLVYYIGAKKAEIVLMVQSFLKKKSSKTVHIEKDILYVQPSNWIPRFFGKEEHEAYKSVSNDNVSCCALDLELLCIDKVSSFLFTLLFCTT